MKKEGPLLELLLRRLAECPPDFLPRKTGGNEPAVAVGAVVSDLLSDLGGEMLSRPEAERFTNLGSLNLLQVVLISCWLLHDEWFREHGGFAKSAKDFLQHLDELAATVKSELFITDGERREELVRRALKALGLRPKGENENEAQDRLTEIDSIEAKRVAEEMRAAEARAKKVREAMARRAAEEAAAKVSRE